MKILNIVGARPNFIKIGPIQRACTAAGVDAKIVHTGQHYDARMNTIFFEQMEIPRPDFSLEVGSATHTVQTANIMVKFEQVLLEEKPDLVLVVGDVNSTIACALVAVKMGIPVAHVEAGLRSGDRNMPEEINRILTDSISDYLFVTENSGIYNLGNEGVPEDKIHFVGNVMIDSLVYLRKKANAIPVLETLGLNKGGYILTTMHRPSNVDTEESLKAVIEILRRTARRAPLVFPMHPRTRNNLAKFNLQHVVEEIQHLQIIEPQGYLEFLHLMEHAKAVVTDSGGIQEETSFLQIPCLTFRKSTERPVTVTLGSNSMIESLDPEKLDQKLDEIFNGSYKTGMVPPLWDGNAAERIVQILTS